MRESLILDGLAVYRLTRLVTADVILDRPREAFIAWASSGLKKPRHPKLAELIQCPWCASVHIALAVVAARRLVPRAWQPLATALALSAAAGYISTQLEE